MMNVSARHTLAPTTPSSPPPHVPPRFREHQNSVSSVPNPAHAPYTGKMSSKDEPRAAGGQAESLLRGGDREGAGDHQEPPPAWQNLPSNNRSLITPNQPGENGGANLCCRREGESSALSSTSTTSPTPSFSLLFRRARRRTLACLAGHQRTICREEELPFSSPERALV